MNLAESREPGTSDLHPIEKRASGIAHEDYAGETLWQADQPFFVYAAVSIPEDEAIEIVEEIRRKHRIQATELHAIQPLRRDRGKRAMMEIVESIVPRSSVVVFHKRYSLGARMFEYLIEPASCRRHRRTARDAVCEIDITIYRRGSESASACGVDLDARRAVSVS